MPLNPPMEKTGFKCVDWRTDDGLIGIWLKDPSRGQRLAARFQEQMAVPIREELQQLAELLRDVEAWNNNNPWGESADVDLPELRKRIAERERMLTALTNT